MWCRPHNRGYEFRKLVLVDFYFFSVFFLNLIFQYLVCYKLAFVIFSIFFLELSQSHVSSHGFNELTHIFFYYHFFLDILDINFY